MNALLDKAEKWLTELGIRTIARPTCLMVNREDVTSLTTQEDLLKEIREALGTNKFYWSANDAEHFYLDCW